MLHTVVFGVYSYAASRDCRLARAWIRFWSIWYPELRRFRSKYGAIANWRRVFEGRMTAWMILTGLPFAIVVGGLSGFTSMWLLPLGMLLWMPVVICLAVVVNREFVHQCLRRSLRCDGVFLCLTCGYDLAGSKSGICPDCGEAVQQG